MAEKVSPGKSALTAAEERTAQVGAENKQDEQAQQAQSRAAEKRQGERSAQSDEDPAERRAKLVRKLDKADSAADKLRQAQDEGDSEVVGLVSLNPYPEYADRDAGELKSLAESRNVEINRDVEKSEWVRLLREKDPQNSAALDFMTLDELRSLGGEKGVELPSEFVTAHLITELRAADTGVRSSGQYVL